MWIITIIALHYIIYRFYNNGNVPYLPLGASHHLSSKISMFNSFILEKWNIFVGPKTWNAWMPQLSPCHMSPDSEWLSKELITVQMCTCVSAQWPAGVCGTARSSPKLSRWLQEVEDENLARAGYILVYMSAEAMEHPHCQKISIFTPCSHPPLCQTRLGLDQRHGNGMSK